MLCIVAMYTMDIVDIKTIVFLTGWMDGWVDGCIRMDGWMHACMHVCMHVCMYGPVSRVPESVSLGDHTIGVGGPGIRSPDSYIPTKSSGHNNGLNAFRLNI